MILWNQLKDWRKGLISPSKVQGSPSSDASNASASYWRLTFKASAILSQLKSKTGRNIAIFSTLAISQERRRRRSLCVRHSKRRYLLCDLLRRRCLNIFDVRCIRLISVNCLSFGVRQAESAWRASTARSVYIIATGNGFCRRRGLIVTHSNDVTAKRGVKLFFFLFFNHKKMMLFLLFPYCPGCWKKKVSLTRRRLCSSKGQQTGLELGGAARVFGTGLSTHTLTHTGQSQVLQPWQH